MFTKIYAYQQKIALCLGFLAVATIGFFGGKSINSKSQDAQLPVISATANYNETKDVVQTEQTTKTEQKLDCEGKIKGSASLKYHLPGGAFYKRTTNPIACFDTEAQAAAAGFTKSSR